MIRYRVMAVVSVTPSVEVGALMLAENGAQCTRWAFDVQLFSCRRTYRVDQFGSVHKYVRIILVLLWGAMWGVPYQLVMVSN